jgi:tetratricopeptide (TPR) repeat protein
MSARAELATLEASGLVEVAILEPELEYLFRHALVQDAAYGSLLKQDRRALHRTAAETLLALYPDRRRELAGVIGMHLERAGDGAAAAEHLVVAGEHAVERFANHEAIGFFDRAIALLPDDDPRVDLRLRAAIGATRASWSFAGRDEALARLESAIAKAMDHGDRRLLADALFLCVFLRRQRGETEATSPYLKIAVEKVKEIGEAIGDPVARGLPKAFMGIGMVFTGQLREGATLAEEALAPIEDQADPLSVAIAWGFVTLGYARLGDFAAAERTLARAQRMADRGDPIARLDTNIARSAIAIERGEVGAGAALAMRCAAESEALGAVACSLSSNVMVGVARLAEGDVQGAKPPLERGQELGIVSNIAPLRTLAQGLLGTVNTRLGNLIGAPATLEALASARATGDRYGEATLLRGRSRAYAAQAAPDWPAALADLDAAAALFAAMGARPSVARTERDRARALRSLGREAEAVEAETRWRMIGSELGLKDLV